MRFKLDFKLYFLYQFYTAYTWLSMSYKQARELEAHSEGSNPNVCVIRSSEQKGDDETIRKQARAHFKSLGPEQSLKFGVVPDLPVLGKAYYYLSTMVHLIMVVAYPLFYGKILDKSGKNYFFSCLWPRLLMDERISQRVTLIFCWNLCTLHIVWRTCIGIMFRRQFHHGCAKFMLADEKIVKKVIDLTANPRNGSSYATIGYGCDLWLAESWQFKALRDCMFFSVPNKTTGPKYILRPNRTIEAHQRLIRRSKLVFALIAALWLLIGGYVVVHHTITMIYRQNRVYEGCQLVDQDGKSIFRFLLTFLVTFVVLVDSANSGTVASAFAMSQIWDIYEYWSELQKWTAAIKQELSLLRATGSNIYASRQAFSRQLDEADDKQLTSSCNQKGRPRRFKGQLDEAIRVVQWYASDFFHEICEVDKFIGTIITFTICVWLSFNTLFTLTGIQTGASIDNGNHIIVRGFQLAGLALALTFFLPIVWVRNSIESGYATFCSIMALDGGTASKREWIKISMFYTERPRYSFTCFDSRIFSRLVIMRVLSYTITFIFVVENLHLAAR